MDHRGDPQLIDQAIGYKAESRTVSVRTVTII